MKRYTKIIDGKIVIKPKNEIIIRKNGSVTYNPSEAKILDDGWVEYIAPEPTAEDKLISAKNIKLHNIRQYDASDAVNVFYINELPIWLDKATRAGLKLRFEAEIAMGKTETSL